MSRLFLRARAFWAVRIAKNAPAGPPPTTAIVAPSRRKEGCGSPVPARLALATCDLAVETLGEKGVGEFTEVVDAAGMLFHGGLGRDQANFLIFGFGIDWDDFHGFPAFRCFGLNNTIPISFICQRARLPSATELVPGRVTLSKTTDKIRALLSAFAPL